MSTAMQPSARRDLLDRILGAHHAEGLLLKRGDQQLRQRFILAEAALQSGLDQLFCGVKCVQQAHGFCSFLKKIT